MQKSTNKEILFIVLIFVLINAALFYKDGVKIVADSGRYIDYASNLRKGFYFDPHNFWYIGYSLYIFFIKVFQSDLLWIVVGQYALSLLAVITLYNASLCIWNNKQSALFTCLCYLIFIDLSSWNAYVLTESIYTSFTCFSLYCLASIVNKRVNAWFIAFTVAIVLFTIFIKPTGIALAGAILCVLVFLFARKLANKIATTILLVFTGCCFLYLVNQRLSTFLIMENYELGEVIYGVTTISDRSEVEGLILTTPTKLYRPAANLSPLFKIISFFFHHPLYWIKLFFAKAFYLLLHVRPFWSWTHNLFSVAILIPSYWFCGKALMVEKSKSIVVLFAVAYLNIHILSVCMTSEDWDGRFLMPMLPVIFLLTGHGVTTWLGKFKTRKWQPIH